ncbi:MAG: OmpA family protein [Bacteroidia bacterium]|nr:OmpA family protein [Bacteroidia bacterium]MBT8277890.1 OmpA family protein [Bacteroidia bacterium]NND25155.1 OmpA family protein [Flavobacteriaceae bacterium]NNK61528.1 OmpA family protein [Flavobacteriaceae bacterium]NNL33938.1 OmpA family protein [Flavobacteriaceae bacterium]
MKNLSRLMFVLLLVTGFNNANAQDDNNPWQISIGFNAVDLYPVGENAPLGEYFDEYFNVTDHYNVVPVLSTFTISKYLGDNFSFGVTGSINRIEKVGDASARDLTYFGADGIIKYDLGNLLNLGKFDPYLGVGGGYTWVQKIGAGTLNGSLGLNYWLSDKFAVTAQSTYKHSFEDYLPKHFQHSVGVSVKFGGKDTDGDGIYDKDDECPEVAGLAAFNGCPDTDGDGIKDGDDACPNEAGLAEFNGCPDADGDGVPDNADDCPNTPGLKSLAGCPDADGDGVKDGDDQCPNEAGPAANNGCPWPDSDGDGVLDKDDQCPNEAGTVANNGCPEVNPTEEVMATLNSYARTILFDTGKSSFKNETMPVLTAMTAIFKEYPNADFSIEGHTDSVGSSSSNKLLSERRANAVRDYLIANGINADRLTAVGLGEEYPIDNNKTRSGRKNNRRVEVKLKN